MQVVKRICLLFLMMMCIAQCLYAQSIDVAGLRESAWQAHETGETDQAFTMQLQVMQYSEALNAADWDRFALYGKEAGLPGLEIAIMKERWRANPFHSKAGALIRDLPDREQVLSDGETRWLTLTTYVPPLIVLAFIIVLTICLWVMVAMYVFKRKGWQLICTLVLFLATIASFIPLLDFYSGKTVGEVALIKPVVKAYPSPTDQSNEFVSELEGKQPRLYPIMQSRGEWLQIKIDSMPVWVQERDVMQIGTNKPPIKKGELLLAPNLT